MFEFMGCSIHVEPKHMNAVVLTESAGQQYAIGIVGHYLSRQPQSKKEALVIINQLKLNGYNYSVGLAQVNQINFAAYKLTEQTMFDTCTNLTAGSLILKRCYDKYSNWSKAYSCYYSGNPKTGFSHGYVQKVNNNLTAQLLTNIRRVSSNGLPIQIIKTGGATANVIIKQSLLERRLASNISIYF